MKNLARFRLRDGIEHRGPGAAVAYKTAELALRALRDYHRHEVIGVGSIPREGAAILAANHSFATYDGMFFGVVLEDEVRRRAVSIGDRLMLGLPILGPFLRDLGFVEGTRESVVDVLRRGDLLFLAPGGMREALRSSKEKYRIDWRGRTGFVWASLLSGAPIILAACPRGDDIFEVADLGITRRAYARFKLPIALVHGIGPTLVPRPVKLRHLVSEPILPEVPPDRVSPEDVAAHHAKVVARMQRLMREALDLG